MFADRPGNSTDTSTLRPTAVGATLYGRIRSDILFGRLAPGQKLKLDTLRDTYGASLPTLREILTRLASEDLVDAPAQRGFFVKPVSRADLEEIADLRILLECDALRRSIARGDDDWEASVVAAYHRLHRMEERMAEGCDTDKAQWKRCDWEFHLALIAACGSRNLLSLHRSLFDKYLRYQLLVLTNRGPVAVDEHARIMQAAIGRHEDEAAAILRTHILGGLSHTLCAMD